MWRDLLGPLQKPCRLCGKHGQATRARSTFPMERVRFPARADKSLPRQQHRCAETPATRPRPGVSRTPPQAAARFDCLPRAGPCGPALLERQELLGIPAAGVCPTRRSGGSPLPVGWLADEPITRGGVDPALPAAPLRTVVRTIRLPDEQREKPRESQRRSEPQLPKEEERSDVYADGIPVHSRAAF